jgi:hypothetical protein
MLFTSTLISFTLCNSKTIDMKDKLEIIVFAVLFAFVGVRLYQKYVKKDSGRISFGKKSGSTFSSSKKDDDYEPYSKK